MAAIAPITTIRTAARTSSIDVLGAVSAAASTVTKTIQTVGRVSDAGYAYTDAWANDVESNAKAMSKVAGAHAEDRATAWLFRKESEILSEITTDQDKARFNELKAKYFG